MLLKPNGLPIRNDAHRGASAARTEHTYPAGSLASELRGWNGWEALANTLYQIADLFCKVIVQRFLNEMWVNLCQSDVRRPKLLSETQQAFDVRRIRRTSIALHNPG